MDFFEALKRTAANVLTEGEGSPVIEEWAAINATIEALKEMMVGKPEFGPLRHWADGRTFIDYTPRDSAHQCCTILEGHHGTDGEEVYVTVFRRK